MQLDRRDFKSESSHIHHAKLQSKLFPVGLSIELPASLLLVVMKAGHSCLKTGEDKEKIEEANVSLAVSNEICMDAAIVVPLSDLGGSCTLKGEQRTSLTVFGKEEFFLGSPEE